jgi:hypothetical protein
MLRTGASLSLSQPKEGGVASRASRTAHPRQGSYRSGIASYRGLRAAVGLTTRYTRIALTQKLRRIIDEGVGYGLALEGISAAEVARGSQRGG